ncbi:MAG: hypothetical protein F4W95_00055 [Chloroflexi bacterium]|nr:hypothetical protein [Chloroflexota bacterium]MYD46862.1 hypothetical protein [Chloroflexota bacterium]
MHPTDGISQLPDRTVECIQFAKNWWAADAFRLLPSEADEHTVYVIDFYERCKYFGYTRESVFYRAASLAAHIDSWALNAFVAEHAARVPYVIRCIKSGLDDLQARRPRNMLVPRAPQNLLTRRGSIVQTANAGCRIRKHFIRRRLPSSREMDSEALPQTAHRVR